MSVLTDREIRRALRDGHIKITPPVWADIQPTSVDLHLGDEFRTVRPDQLIDLRDPGRATTDLAIGEVLRPGSFILGTTIERIELPDDILARLEGRSSLGRIGLMIHATAGYLDPGFRGQITLELSNVGPAPLLLRPGIGIAQVSFYQLNMSVRRPYGHEGLGSKYQDQSGPTAARSPVKPSSHAGGPET